MPISDAMSPDPAQSKDASGAPADSPTVIRGGSTSARRNQAAGVVPPAVAVALPGPGEAVGTFVLEEAIGVGGMGAVFRALDVQLDRHVALKLLPPDQTSDPEIVQRFYQEGRSAAQLDHENIARVYSIGQDGPHHYIAFEFIEGVTVRRRVDEAGPMPAGEAVDISVQIAQALIHAAARGVVHRDIKPSNIILTPQGRAKLVDMGLARRFERESDRGLTQSGMTLGTFDYISPEQARDPRDVDVRSDLYSLGCTMFHMLTGQPPFPGGTVLQKLLQHQEEPPPDICKLNPAVGPALARTITRLLAKDRDRRYQSPEQLLRDLMVFAGQLGISVGPADQHAWLFRGHRVTWERHLVWFLPALGFLVVLGGLLWWAWEANGPGIAEAALISQRSLRAESITKGRSPLAAGKTGTPPLASDEDGTTVPIPTASRNVPVRPSDDLLAVIAQAPPRSIITLTEDGPYRVGGRTLGSGVTLPLRNRDLTIKAEAGCRPVISFAADAPQHEGTPAALLAFSGGNVTLEGLMFELEQESPDAIVAAVSTLDTELTIRECLFRQTAVHSGRNRAALRVQTGRSGSEVGGLPPRVFADACHFDGGQIGVMAEGTTFLVLRNCTMGPGSPSIWIDNGSSQVPLQADLQLWNCSLMAGSGPILEFEGTLARVRADQCVFAPGGPAQPTLVAVDNPRNLVWHGRSNLYSRIHAYLASLQNLDGSTAIMDFGLWKETSTDVREVDELVATTSVWKSPHAFQELVIDLDDPGRAFRLAEPFATAARFGVGQGSFGSRPNEVLAMPNTAVVPSPRRATGPGVDEAANPARKSERPDRSQDVARSPALEAGTPGSAIASITEGASPLAPTEEPKAAESLPVMPPMSNTPPTETSEPVTPDVARNETGDRNEPGDVTTPPAKPPEAVAKTQPARPRGNSLKPRSANVENLVRTTEQLLSQIKARGDQGGTLTIAHDADLEVPSTEFSSPSAWRLEAEAGPGRPRIRFRPSVFTTRTPTAWSALFNLRAGSLHLQGLDMVLPSQDIGAPLSGPQAAIGLAVGTHLDVRDCTITVANETHNSAAIVVQPEGPNLRLPARSDTPSSRTASISLTDTFVRSVGDGVSVSTGRFLDLQLQNVIVGTDGSLLHAMGSSQNDRSTTVLKVKIERSLARSRGGLVFLESTQDEKELPLTEIEARRSTFSTAGTAPLIRLDGQGQMEGLRDRIVWKGDKIAYDQITTYRRDQILQTGVSPRDYSRSDWRTAFDPTDESPVLDGVKFLRKPEIWRSARSLTREDLKVGPSDLAADRGPDFTRIPDAPPVGS